MFSINSLDNLRKYYNKKYQDVVESTNTYDDNCKLLLSNTKSPKTRLRILMDIEQKQRFPNYILRRTDHLSMAFSLEIRVPFCQPKIKDFANNLPLSFKLDENNQKNILFKAAEQIVPIDVITRKSNHLQCQCWKYLIQILKLSSKLLIL